jgi:hypothetical protein
VQRERRVGAAGDTGTATGAAVTTATLATALPAAPLAAALAATALAAAALPSTTFAATSLAAAALAASACTTAALAAAALGSPSNSPRETQTRSQTASRRPGATRLCVTPGMYDCSVPYVCWWPSEHVYALSTHMRFYAVDM